MSSQDKTRRARERIAMSYDFEDVLKRLKAKRDAVATRSEEESVERLRAVLDDTVDRCSVRVTGNHVTDAGFIAEELDISTPSTIGDCSEKLYAGLTRLEGELDLFETIAATVDLDPDDARHLTVDLALKERSKLTASIGATHDTHLSSVNGNTSVGIRNMFGRGERLDVAADMGMATTNEFNMRTAVYNVSNQYSVTFTKPRLLLPYYLDPQVLSDCVLGAAAAQSPDGAVRGRHNRVLGPSQKYTSTLRFFNQKLDRSRMSSYSEDCIGLTATMLSTTLHSWFRQQVPAVAAQSTREPTLPRFGFRTWSGLCRVSSMKAALHHFEVASEMTTAHATALAEMSEAQRLEFKRVRSDASYYLALCMLNGHGLERPLIESGMRSLQQLSAADGNPLAAFHLSEVYRDGLYSEEADYKRHLAFLKEAAQLGHLCAKQQLADYYQKTGKKVSEISGGEFEIPPLPAWPQ